MMCPECGNERAKDVKLFLSISYLCPNADCSYFDAVYAAGLLKQDLPKVKLDFDWEYRLPDGTYVMADD